MTGTGVMGDYIEDGELGGGGDGEWSAQLQVIQPWAEQGEGCEQVHSEEGEGREGRTDEDSGYSRPA